MIGIARVTFTNRTWALVRHLSCFLDGCNWMTLGENIWQLFFSDAPISLPCPYLQGFNTSCKRQTSASKRVALGEILLHSYQHIICHVLNMHVGAYLRSHYSCNIQLPLFSGRSRTFCSPSEFQSTFNGQRKNIISGVNMHSSSYSYHSSDSVFSNTLSTRTSLDANENFLSVNCGPTLINSCISFGNESFDGHRY